MSSPKTSSLREKTVLTMKRMGAVESDSVKVHKACERASETCEQILHGQNAKLLIALCSD